MALHWDPQLYLQFGDERARALVDLVSRIPADDPTDVVDLGCGPGNSTAILAQRWPRASLVGVDSSTDMIEKARASLPSASFEVDDLRGGWARAGRPTWCSPTPRCNGCPATSS